MSLGAVVEIAFTGGLTSPVWTDVSDYVSELQAERGRQQATGAMQAGQATLVLTNTDGRFSPGRPASPYWPNVLPRLPVRISCRAAAGSGGWGLGTWGIGTWGVGTSEDVQPIWFGLIERWDAPVTDGDYGSVTVTAVDLTKYLSQLQMPYSAAVSELLLDSPSGAWPLQSVQGNTLPGLPTGFGYSAGLETIGSTQAATFGGPSIIPGMPDGGTLQMPANPSAGAIGPWISLPVAVTIGSTSLWAVEFWTVPAYSDPTGSATWAEDLRVTFAAGGYQSYFFVEHDLTNDGGYRIRASIGGPSPTVTTSVAVPLDTSPHQLVLKQTDTHSLALYIDGTPQAYLDFSVSPTQGLLAMNLSRNSPSAYQLLSVWAGGPPSDSRILAHYQAGQGFAGENEADRLTRQLTYAGNPPGTNLTQAPRGFSTLGPCDWGAGANLWALLAATMDAAGGLLFPDAQGGLTAQDRHYRVDTTTAVTLADSLLTAVESGLTFEISDQAIVNDATVTRSGYPGTFHANDPASASAYGQISTTETVNLYWAEEAQARAEWLVVSQSTPRVTVTASALFLNAVEQQAAIRDLDLSSFVVIDELPSTAPAAGGYYVEHISHSVSSDGWLVSMLLSPSWLDEWAIEDAVYGYIDSTHAISY